MKQKSYECRNDTVTRVTVRHILHIPGERRADVQVVSGREGPGTMLMSGE